MEYEYKVAKLKAGGFIATYQGSPVSGSFSNDIDKVTDWIEKSNAEVKAERVESKAFKKLGHLPTNTTKDSIAFIINEHTEWMSKLSPKLLIEVINLLDKIKVTPTFSGDVPEIIVANILIDVYNNNAITVDRARIIYSKEED